MTGIDWQSAARSGHLTEVLHLFACRLAWRRHHDLRAYGELVRASEDGKTEIRAIAASMLDPASTGRSSSGHDEEDSTQCR